MFLIRVLFWVGSGRAATSVVVPASSRRRAYLLLLPKLDQVGFLRLCVCSLFFFSFFGGWPIWKCWFPKFFWALLTSIRPTPPMWLGFCRCCGWLVGLSQEGANMARSSSFAGDEGTHVSTRGGPFQYLDSLRYRLHLCFDLAIEIFSFLPFGAVVQSRWVCPELNAIFVDGCPVQKYKVMKLWLFLPLGVVHNRLLCPGLMPFLWMDVPCRGQGQAMAVFTRSARKLQLCNNTHCH